MWHRVRDQWELPGSDDVAPRFAPAGSLRADAVEAVRVAVAASTRMLGSGGPAWELIIWLTSGQLLTPTTPTARAG